MTKICLPTDLSKMSVKAIPIGYALSQKIGAEFHVVHCMKPLLDIPQKDQEIFNNIHSLCNERILKEIKNVNINAKLENFQFHILEGKPAESIEEFCNKNAMDLVVMSTHGYSGLKRLLMGSVTKKMLHNSTLPILAISPQIPDDFDFSAVKQILAPVDIYAPSNRAIESAVSLAKALNIPITLLHSLSEDHEWAGLYADTYGLAGITRSYDTFVKEESQKASLILKDLANTLKTKHDSIQIDIAIKNGVPEDDIRESAQGGKTVVAMQTHVDSTLDRILLGSVTERSLQGIESPILLFDARSETTLSF